jgi:chromosome segregation ATPase
MGRIAKTSPDAIARACAKLQVEGNLTIHNLRMAVGGGGAEYLARSLRAWRQQQREEARTPIEQLISGGLRVALTEELQRAQAETAEEVHGLYAEDKGHLEFCLTELKRLEEEADGLQEALAAEKTEVQRSQNQAQEHTRDLEEQLQEQRARADRMTERFEDLQRQHHNSQAELAVAREQRGVAEAALTHQRAQHETLQTHLAAATAENVGKGAQLASFQERCAQQQETLGYFRADLKTKVDELGASRAAATTLQQELREATRAAASAEAALQELRNSRVRPPAGHRYILVKSPERGDSKQRRAPTRRPTA